MIAKECKECVWWLQANCDGESQKCNYHETYTDWDNLEKVVESYRD